MPPVAVPQAVAPTRGAAGDADLRLMLPELASSKACGMIRGGFQGLSSPDHPDVVTGVLRIRQCEITNAGAHVTFHITGNGWLWVDQTKSKAGLTFTVRQYVRFSIPPRSITATCAPASQSVRAHVRPAGSPPTMIASNAELFTRTCRAPSSPAAASTTVAPPRQVTSHP